MPDISYDSRGWKDLGISEKLKLSVAGALIVASIILGFASFIILYEIPTSVIGLDGLWLSTALAVLGITSYFHNEMVQFQGKVNERLLRMDKNRDEE